MKRKSLAIWIIATLTIFACTLGQAPPERSSPEPDTVISTSPAPPADLPSIPPSGNLIHPEDFTYLGVFRLPDASGGSNWEYSGHGLTYYPAADQAQSTGDFVGSLFGFGHDQHLQVSEISIPDPIISKNLDDLNTATTIQPFADISNGLFSPEEMSIPRAGIAYLDERLYFTFGQHIQDFEPSHGSASLNLTNVEGAYVFSNYTNYITNDYLFEIPPEWAAALGGRSLASGRAREGLWSGRGIGLFAYDPAIVENGVLTDVAPLLLYGVQQDGLPDIVSDESMAVDDYHEADHWWGGAWLTAGENAAVIFAGTKALGNEWYGYANGVVWAHDCAENNSCPEMPEWPYDDRGFWSESYQAQIIFYDPAQLVAVANGELDSWQPQLYAMLDLTEYLFAPELDFANYKRDFIGAIAFDREHGILYVIERLADEYKSVIHVWQVE
ncbi:MAG: hypothetical protein HN855_02940 [Anaerolineae bacterium]|jgi:hypothetical protein|nr:hypothetical protein [Anaerolineae bacterium]MBT7070017.1 hypothetical protein [Anaerolineae bacterium]MBT7324094.1 hypothetical protein [Anaerolineae bacterium]